MSFNIETIRWLLLLPKIMVQPITKKELQSVEVADLLLAVLILPVMAKTLEEEIIIIIIGLTLWRRGTILLQVTEAVAEVAMEEAVAVAVEEMEIKAILISKTPTVLHGGDSQKNGSSIVNLTLVFCLNGMGLEKLPSIT